MLPSARALAVVSIVVLLAASGGDLATARTPGPQQTPSDVWGYGVVRQAASDHSLPAKDGQSSAGAANSYVRYQPGNSEVRMAGLSDGALNNGTALVTTLAGNGNRYCVIEDFGWYASNYGYFAVHCYNRSGAQLDGTYSGTLLNGQTLTGKSGYLWANDPTNPSTYTPDVTYQYNSTGAIDTITRLSKGHYAVHLPGLATTRGNVQVASRMVESSNLPALCRALSWGASAADLVVNVQCRNQSGAKADAQFDLWFGQGQGLKGPGVAPVAYLDANHPTTASYTPDPLRRYSSAGMAPHVTRSGVGRYLVTLPGMPAGGSAQVTAYGTGSSFCVLRSIRAFGTPQQVGVSCFTPSGAHADTEFGLTYLQ